MNWQAERLHWASILRNEHGEGTPPRTVLLVAHPDDETIGASVLLATFPQIRVVYLTDGAPRDSKLWSADACGSRDEYAAMRRTEVQRALSHVSIPANQVDWLGGIDQEAILAASTLTAKFSEYLSLHGADAVITHAYEGGHPDHDAAALIARLAISQSSAETLLIEMTSYHARAGRCVTGEFLHSDPSSELVIELSEEQRLRKSQMLAAHSSQRAVLAGFGVDRERFRLAPAYDFSKPPHDGPLWYECMRWPMTGTRWRSLAALATREAQECNAAHSA
jgi:N-acetylglucosamine malate deacetylase 2